MRYTKEGNWVWRTVQAWLIGRFLLLTALVTVPLFLFVPSPVGWIALGGFALYGGLYVWRGWS